MKSSKFHVHPTTSQAVAKSICNNTVFDKFSSLLTEITFSTRAKKCLVTYIRDFILYITLH